MAPPAPALRQRLELLERARGDGALVRSRRVPRQQRGLLQAADVGDHIPDLSILQLVAKRRHVGSLDPVLDPVGVVVVGVR